MKKFFQLIPENTNFDFIGKFPFFMTVSTLMVTATVYIIVTKGFNYGVDFTGGTVVQVQFKNPKPSEEVRKLVEEAGEKDATVVASSSDSKEYMITARAQGDVQSSSFLKKLKEKAGAGELTITQTDIVGPKVGAELKGAALRSLLYSLLFIMIYVWLRFDFKFAPGATIALIHDMIITAGFYIVSGKEFDITAIASLLTIAGYSVNDTIVIYDRVREILGVGGDKIPLAQTINRAVNLTLSRTLLTSAITLVSIVPVAVICHGPIQDFAQAMIVGMVAGSYSTIYIAAPLTIYVQKYLERKQVGPKRATA
jgi:preprotein translocase subunit SecF